MKSLIALSEIHDRFGVKYAADKKFLGGMIITIQDNATLHIYAWDRETELNFIKIRQQKFDLLQKKESVNEKIKVVQQLQRNLVDTNNINKLKADCVTNQQAVLGQLNLLHQISSHSEDRAKLLCDIQDVLRNNLFQYSKYQHDINSKSQFTQDDYCLWHYKSLRAFQCCELLLNIQNLYARDDEYDKKDLAKSYNELDRKTKELKSKYDINSVDPLILDQAATEHSGIETDEEKYNAFKSKLILLSELDINACEELLKKECAVYESLIKKLGQPGCNLVEIKSEMNSFYQSKLTQLIDQEAQFTDRLERLDKIYGESKRAPSHLIEGPIAIIDLVSRPECNLLQRFTPSPASFSTSSESIQKISSSEQQSTLSQESVDKKSIDIVPSSTSMPRKM